MDKEAVLKLSVHFKFNTEDMTEQQALDKLEEIMMDINERFGFDVAINVENRYILDRI